MHTSNKGRKRRHTATLTDTPEKSELEKEQAERAQKKIKVKKGKVGQVKEKVFTKKKESTLPYYENNRHPDYRSEESDVEENQFHDDNIDDILEQIDLDNINRQNDMFVHRNLHDFLPDDVADEIWPKDAVPFRTRGQLLARVAILFAMVSSRSDTDCERHVFLRDLKFLLIEVCDRTILIF
ncbi:hypothetical protein JTB14_020429 [Gonioctena quinquepunctata]|nr:hypothetical protein JTB14_020429 [Gonioctena quinquepunctata]